MMIHARLPEIPRIFGGIAHQSLPLAAAAPLRARCPPGFEPTTLGKRYLPPILALPTGTSLHRLPSEPIVLQSSTCRARSTRRKEICGRRLSASCSNSYRFCPTHYILEVLKTTKSSLVPLLWMNDVELIEDARQACFQQKNSEVSDPITWGHSFVKYFDHTEPPLAINVLHANEEKSPSAALSSLSSLSSLSLPKPPLVTLLHFEDVKKITSGGNEDIIYMLAIKAEDCKHSLNDELYRLQFFKRQTQRICPTSVSSGSSPNISAYTEEDEDPEIEEDSEYSQQHDSAFLVQDELSVFNRLSYPPYMLQLLEDPFQNQNDHQIYRDSENAVAVS